MQAFAHGAFAGLEFGEGQQHSPNVGQVGARPGRELTAFGRHDLLRNEFRRCDHEHVFDTFNRRKVIDTADVDEVAMRGPADLVQPVMDAAATRIDAHGDSKPAADERLDLARKLVRARRQNINIVRHARVVDVGVDRLRTAEHGIIPATEELQHSVVDCRQRQHFARGKLAKRQAAVAEHEKSLSPTS
jgi:hypothetical protein